MSRNGGGNLAETPGYEGANGDWECSTRPPDVRDAGGRLVAVGGLPLDAHLRRLDATRAVLIDRLRPMDAADLRRPRRLERYDVTPEWVLHHLLQHEAEHRGQIARIRAAAGYLRPA